MAKSTSPARLTSGLGVAALVLTACGGVQTSAGGGGSDGEGYPSGTVEMYVGASAGGSSDLISREISRGLGEELGASFPVVNREGANGALAAAEVVGAEPDGSTIAVQNASLFTITPLAVSEDEATSIDDFQVVHGVSRDDYVLVASPESGFESIDDLSGERDIRYGTTGVGTGAQLSAALLFGELGISADDVPFDGGAPALTALLGDQVDVAALQVGEARENIEAGEIVPLTVFAPERIDALPDVETAQEQGVDVEVSQYRFMTVPNDTPSEVTDTLVEGLETLYATEAYQEFNERQSLTPMELSGEEMLAQIEQDQQRYSDLIAEYDIDLGES